MTNEQQTVRNAQALFDTTDFEGRRQALIYIRRNLNCDVRTAMNLLEA